MAEPVRDFYRNTLELLRCDEPEPLVRGALEILIRSTTAREVYVEVSGSEDTEVLSWAADGCDELRVSAIRAVISRGIIGESIATGETILTASALEDSRFRELGSVREHGIEAVLCVPIGDETPIGVVYLQGRRDASAAPVFDEATVAKVELLAQAVSLSASKWLRADTASWVGPRPPAELHGLVARSTAMREVVERLRLVAPLDVHVLLTGPSGTGKTRLAQLLHSLGSRSSGPFVALNCAAIPEALAENELFGAEPGAHSTVPKGGLKGKVEAAEGGTLFLDEVAELALPAQAKLLQLLQERTYFRLGGTRARRADVRIVAATNVDLKLAMAERRFREDLYYRLCVFEVRVPTLAERASDLVPLAFHFCRSAANRHGVPVRRLSPGALRSIRSVDWPGNARELENRIESAVLHAHLRGSNTVEASDVFPDGASRDAQPVSLQEATRRFQRDFVLAALESTDWNVAETARRLDVARSHLYTLIRAHSLGRT